MYNINHPEIPVENGPCARARTATHTSHHSDLGLVSRTATSWASQQHTIAACRSSSSCQLPLETSHQGKCISYAQHLYCSNCLLIILIKFIKGVGAGSRRLWTWNCKITLNFSRRSFDISCLDISCMCFKWNSLDLQKNWNIISLCSSREAVWRSKPLLSRGLSQQPHYECTLLTESGVFTVPLTP